MPCLKIVTNVPKTKIPSDFALKIIPTLAKAVQKTEDKFICVITGDIQMSIFGDATTPGAVATLESIGNLGPEENKVITKQITDFVQKELGISNKRFFLSFYNLESYNIGINGTTVQEQFK